MSEKHIGYTDEEWMARHKEAKEKGLDGPEETRPEVLAFEKLSANVAHEVLKKVMDLLREADRQLVAEVDKLGLGSGHDYHEARFEALSGLVSRSMEGAATGAMVLLPNRGSLSDSENLELKTNVIEDVFEDALERAVERYATVVNKLEKKMQPHWNA